jgi:hypothetical protein
MREAFLTIIFGANDEWDASSIKNITMMIMMRGFCG